jgi:hypothetical protein
MNSVLQSPRLILARHRFAQPLWRDTVAWIVACLAIMTLAAMSMPVAAWASSLGNPAPEASAAPGSGMQATASTTAPEGLNPRSTTRCHTCGVVVMVRPLQSAGAAPTGYELTIRFRDGSRRISSHSDHVVWSAGDSIMLIGGDKLADRT